MYLYNSGLLIGRFQMLHRGHVEMINKALDFCRKVVVFIGSAQEHGTERNPFSYAVRYGMLEKVFAGEIASGRLIVRPLYDVGLGDNDSWGAYVMREYESLFYSQPDLYITGCDKERQSWFNDTIAPNMDEHRITRQAIKVSGSDCRQALAYDNEGLWRSMVPYELYDKYSFYQKIVGDIYGK